MFVLSSQYVLFGNYWVLADPQWPNLNLAVACFGLERTSIGGHFPSDEGRVERKFTVSDLRQDWQG
jgi:hypothetical protein